MSVDDDPAGAGGASPTPESELIDALMAPEMADGPVWVFGTDAGDSAGLPGPLASPAGVAVVDGQLRLRHLVRTRKIPQEQRVVARELMPGDTEAELARSALARGFVDALGADCPDDDPTWPVGTEVFYSLMLTLEEAARERGAPNVVSCEIEPRVEPR